jgi:hypothetical protein
MASERREAIKTLIWGAVWIVGAVAFWLHAAGNLIHDLRLALSANVAQGQVTGSWEDAEDGDDGAAPLVARGCLYVRPARRSRDQVWRIRQRSAASGVRRHQRAGACRSRIPSDAHDVPSCALQVRRSAPDGPWLSPVGPGCRTCGRPKCEARSAQGEQALGRRETTEHCPAQ